MSRLGAKKSLLARTPVHISRPAAPWDFQPQGSFVLNVTRWRSLELHKHHRALGLASAPTGSRGAADIAKLRPVQPVTLLRPHAARRAARFFVEKFPGRSLYAVKANPSPDLLKILWDAGVTHYDVASIGEVRLVHETLPEAVQCFMHPVKAEEVIAEAYFEHGVKTFALDTHRGARQDRPRDLDRRRCRDRPQPARPHPRQLGPCQAQPCVRSSAPSPSR